MMIVISVCKIIGIIVLVLLALLAILLFLPVSYELDADTEQKRCAVRISWGFGLVRFRFLYGEQTEMVLSVLFFGIDFLDEERRRRRKNRKQRKAAKKKTKEDKEDAERGPLQRAAGVAATVTHVVGLVRDYELMDAVWPGLMDFLFHVRPRQVRGQKVFGFDDRSVTGQVVGGLALIPLFYQTDLQVTPDFETEETFIRGNIRLKGHMMLFHAVRMLVRWFGQKNFRRFIGALREKKS
ncbi:MAG: hypothetical protein LUD71_00500 [Clostridiales bacterium]|nr:hypothetical protein [Clostridiales bacterium]